MSDPETSNSRHHYTVDARWDADARAWVATSDTVAGLVIEAPTCEEVVEVAVDALPDLLCADGLEGTGASVSLVFGRRVEIIEVAVA